MSPIDNILTYVIHMLTYMPSAKLGRLPPLATVGGGGRGVGIYLMIVTDNKV